MTKKIQGKIFPKTKAEKYLLIHTSCSTENEAEKITRMLLETKLAACIQINKVKSHYIWEEKITATPEFLMIIKSKIANYQKIAELIKANHNYQLPEIIAVPLIKISPEYASWLDKNC